MTGTSLDGVDVVFVEFSFGNDEYQFDIISGHCYDYDPKIKSRLINAPNLSEVALEDLHVDYGLYLGRVVNQFIEDQKISKDSVSFVASHGYTVFHQPDKGYTLQIGDGQLMANELGLKVINDFRSKDVANGGQGAPLVPIGDKYLFSEYQACLNLGGFSNISVKENGEISAFDISPANLPLNKFANSKGKEYDANGGFGRNSQVDIDLLSELNSLEFYSQEGPKSLGTEWLNESFYPLYENHPDPIATLYHHISDQITAVFEKYHLKEVLVTGGGVYNQYLIELLQKKSSTKVVIFKNEIVEFKEALIFAFLGLRFVEGKYNCLKEVTGAKENVMGGKLHIPD